MKLHTGVPYDPRGPLFILGTRIKLGKFEFVAAGGICPFRTGLVGPKFIRHLDKLTVQLF